MTKDRSVFHNFSIIFILLAVILSGCISLAEDITPPPGDNLPVQELPATDQPTQEPTREPDPTPAPVGEDEDQVGTVNVYLIDQTDGSIPLEGMTVRLLGFDSFERVYEEDLPVPGTNHIQFSEVDFPAGRMYFADLAYQGTVYQSNIVQVGGDTESLDLELVVFNTTTDQSALVVDRLHLILEFLEPGSIRVIEIYIISNLGDSTVVPATDGGISIDFPLPEGAYGLEFEDGSLGQRYLETKSGFGDTVSIPPGSGVYPLSVTYWLPYQKNRLDFSQRFNLPVGAVIVMTPAGDIQLKGTNLEDQGVQTIPSGEVQLYSSVPIPAGESLEFRISGKLDPQTAPQNGGLTTSQMIIYGAGGVGVLLLISGVWLYFRNQRQIKDLENLPVAESKDEILDSIIALDDLFAAGDISESDYQQKRKQLKERLRTLSES
jgi:hypothetical protein